MMTRRGIFRSSVFLVLAVAAAHVPACEYGSRPDPVTGAAVSAPRDAAPVFALDVPIVLHA